MTPANTAPVANMLLFLMRFAVVALALALAQPSFAQATFTYDNSTNGNINAGTSCASPLVRTFTVSDNFVVNDVRLGVFATHSWRGDIRVTLVAPDGTRVQLVDGDATATSGDNLNVLLDDGAAITVNSTNPNGAHSTANPPPFENTFSPNAPLSAFAGVSSAGTWQLEICDIFPGADNGRFRFAQLQLTSLPANSADLSLTMSVSNPTPNPGASISYTLSVSNNGPATATSVEVVDQLPAGFAFASSSGFGTFDPVTGIWQVASIAPGQTRTLTISGSVSAPAGSSVTNYAEVSSSSFFDPDSTPGNFSAGEDDDATAPFTVQGSRSPGVPPTLSCPAGQNVFDWDVRSWVPGSLANQYNVANFGDVGFTVSSNGVFVNDPSFGGLSPTVTDTNTGGFPVAEDSLHLYLDFADRQQTATTQITLPNGVAGAQFTIFDIDFAANDFADKVTVTGSYKGTTVIPVLTNGSANYVVGNTAVGDVLSGNGSGAGNVVVTFSQAIDTITVVYGNAASAPASPDGQAIAIHDLDICAPATDLSISKISSVISDPVNLTENPKAIPGATIEYLISVANVGVSDTDAGTVVVTDNGPGEAKLCWIDRNAGPVTVADPANTSGLTYTFSSLGSTSDDLEFSNDNGVSWTYVPSADGDGCDSAVTNFRVQPSGVFSAGGNFTLTLRYIIE